MIEIPEAYHATQASDRLDTKKFPHRPLWKLWPAQFFRFGFVGLLNTFLDVLLLNGFLWLFPTTHTFLILLFNSLAYAIGAVNSFFLNKYWTFGARQQTSWGEIKRFALTTLLGIACNDILIWLTSDLFHSLTSNSSLATNASKLTAIAGTVFVSYFGMRLWVFVKKPQSTISPELHESASLLSTTAEQISNRCQFCQNHSCHSQVACPYTEIVEMPTQKLRLNHKIKKVLLVNNLM